MKDRKLLGLFIRDKDLNVHSDGAEAEVTVMPGFEILPLWEDDTLVHKGGESGYFAEDGEVTHVILDGQLVDTTEANIALVQKKTSK